jgi:hypothetical protein
MKKAQYRKYKEIYRIDINILKTIIKDCDAKINQINNEITKNIKKQNQKGGENNKKIFKNIDNDEILYLLIPNNDIDI